jgi:hypothetical protein
LTSLTAFQNLINRKATEKDFKELVGLGFDYSTFGQKGFTPNLAEWVSRDGQVNNFSIKDVRIQEDIFSRDEVSTDALLKVPGIPLDNISFGRMRSTETVAKVGLYKISTTMEDWAKEKLRLIKEARDLKGSPLSPFDAPEIFTEDLEWVNDDDGLVNKVLVAMEKSPGPAHSDHAIYLISADIKLAIRIKKTTLKPVVLIDPGEFIEMHPDRDIDWASYTPDLSYFQESVFYHTPYWRPPFIILMDRGSILSACTGRVAIDSYIAKRTNYRYGRSVDGTRFESFHMKYSRRTHMKYKFFTPDGVNKIRPQWQRGITL